MHQTFFVGMVHYFGHRRHQFHDFIERQPGVFESLGKVGAIDELRDDVARKLVGIAHVVHRHDVWMVEVGNGAGLVKIGVGIFRA